MAAAQKCAHANCNKPRHINKPYCLDHFKEQDNYSYGLDADLKKKMDAKLDPAKVAQAQAWLEQLSGVSSGGQDLHSYLKNGIVLCKAINAIKSGSVKSISTSSMPFPQMENISAYLAVCKSWGMKSSDLFMTKDLYENANMVIVVDNIHCLGSLSRKQAGFSGPYLGVKMADEAKREFTAAQLNTANVPSRQTVGSYGYQDETHNPTLSRQIVKNVTGIQASAVPSKQTQGSYGYQVQQDKSLDKIVKQPVNTPTLMAAANAQQTAAATGGASGKFCSGCGAPREGAGKFCSGCGHPF